MNRTPATLAFVACASALAACNTLLGISSGTGGQATTTSSTTVTGGAATTSTTVTGGAGTTSTSSSSTTSTASTSTTSSSTTSSSTTTTTTGETDAGDGGPPVSLQDCVLLLNMDETSWSGANAVKDSSGNQNDGTASGSAAPTSAGKLGGAGSFDGNGYVSVPSSATLQGPFTALTYAAWIYPTGLGTVCDSSGSQTFGGIISKRLDYNDDVAFTMFLWYDNGTFPQAHLFADLNDVRLNGNATFSNGQWYHLAVVYDSTLPAASNTTLYVNGVPDGAAQAGPAGGLAINSVPLTIGDLTLQSFDSCERFQGKIDEVVVWSRALTATEIQTLYTSTTEL